MVFPWKKKSGRPTVENGHFGLLKKSPKFLKGALRAFWQWNELAKLTAGGGAMLRRRR